MDLASVAFPLDAALLLKSWSACCKRIVNRDALRREDNLWVASGRVPNCTLSLIPTERDINAEVSTERPRIRNGLLSWNRVRADNGVVCHKLLNRSYKDYTYDSDVADENHAPDAQASGWVPGKHWRRPCDRPEVQRNQALINAVRGTSVSEEDEQNKKGKSTEDVQDVEPLRCLVNDHGID
jgi:hypothetical protein